MVNCDGHVAATACCLFRFLTWWQPQTDRFRSPAEWARCKWDCDTKKHAFGYRHGTLIGDVWRKVTSIGTEALAQLLAFAQSSVDSNYGIVKSGKRGSGGGSELLLAIAVAKVVAVGCRMDATLDAAMLHSVPEHA